MLKKSPVQETKDKITELSKKIKALKKKLRGVPHRYPGSPTDQNELWRCKYQIRGLFLLYAWFRGQRVDQIQAPLKDPYDGNYQIAKWYASQELDSPESKENFLKWALETSK